MANSLQVGHCKILIFEGEYRGSQLGPATFPSQFSLNEEARNTERHYMSHPDLKLRHSRVTFISAGTAAGDYLTPVMLKSRTSGQPTESQSQETNEVPVKISESRPTAHTAILDAEMSSMTLKDMRSVPAPQVNLMQGLDSMSKRSNIERGLLSAEVRNKASFSNVRDTDEPLITDPATSLMRRSPSPARSDSSGEVIIFAGRHQLCDKGPQKQASEVLLGDSIAQHVSKSSGQRDSVVTVLDDPINVQAHEFENLPKRRPLDFSSLGKAIDYFGCHSRPTAVTRSERRNCRRRAGKEMKDEGILDDYVANIRDGSDLEAFVESSMLTQRDLGGSDTAGCQDEVKYPLTTPVGSGPMMRESDECDSAEMEDFAELSPSNEVPESIEQILSKREKPSGVQYLAVGAGGTVDDARWLPISLLNDQHAGPSNQEFEENTRSEMAQDSQVDMDDKEDEKILQERMMAKATDEQVARLLSKQEELGLGSDDLILFDGRDCGTDSQDELQLDGLWERAVTHAIPSRSKRIKKSRSHVPCATTSTHVLDQDPCNGFAVMDHHRPSLRKRPKGRCGKHSLEISDSEFEQSIYTAWEKDRIKKKERKQEREELRAQGLSGRKKTFDLKVKYSQGISMVEVKNEIRDFLLSSMERWVVFLASLPSINTNADLVWRFPQCLRENAKWCMKLPVFSS